jgi:acetone carboxylase gamma subunit
MCDCMPSDVFGGLECESCDSLANLISCFFSTGAKKENLKLHANIHIHVRYKKIHLLDRAPIHLIQIQPLK